MDGMSFFASVFFFFFFHFTAVRIKFSYLLNCLFSNRSIALVDVFPL